MTNSPDLNTQWRAAMYQGDFAGAWSIADTVLATRDPATRDDPTLPYHLRWVWDGRPFDGRAVLVRCYHGLGDTLQFLRYLPALRRRTRHLTLEVQPELVPLVAMQPGLAVDHLHGFDVATPLPPAEVDIEIMELCHALRLRPQDLPAADNDMLIHPPPAPMRPDRRRIGLCWRAGDWDPSRSIALEQLLTVLAEFPAIQLFSLQRGAGMEEMRPIRQCFANPDDQSLDILDTSALVQALDLVITVDTMIAHLAGALGSTAWILLREPPDWRWLAEGSATPWYPTLRLFRQSHTGDWTRPLREIKQALRSFSASPD